MKEKKTKRKLSEVCFLNILKNLFSDIISKYIYITLN